MIKHTNPLVEVIWHDAATTYGWECVDDVETSEDLCITVGFLIKKGDTNITIASSIDDQEGKQSNSRIKIPIGMIKTIKELVVNYKKVKPNVNESNPQQ